MPSPALLMLDTDALLQHLLGGTLRVLRELKVQYGVQAFIVPEVENEIRRSRRFATRVNQSFTKAISNGVVKVLEAGTYSTVVQSSPVLQVAAVGIAHADIQTLGAAYSQRVDRGEAYTFATAYKLGQPAVSNDMSAIVALDRAGLELPQTILRAFDLVVFGYQAGLLEEADGDRFRQVLLAESEWVPREWKNASFSDGLKRYVPRLVDGSKPLCGVAPSTPGAAWSTPITIVPA